jgi:hypothetical protein
MGVFDIFKSKSKLTDENKDKPSDGVLINLKSELNAIQKEIYLYLKPLGFKKKGRTFNRQTEDGIYQVINIQSGKYEFGDKYVIPGLRENYYGKFTINLGVMVKEIYDLDIYHKNKDVYQDYDCTIRTRLSRLTVKKDIWWAITDNNLTIAKEIIEGLNSHGILWLDNFENRDKIGENWGNIEDSAKRAKLDVALIVFHRDKEKGATLIQEYYNSIENHRGHKEYVRELAGRLGLEIKI